MMRIGLRALVVGRLWNHSTKPKAAGITARGNAPIRTKFSRVSIKPTPILTTWHQNVDSDSIGTEALSAHICALSSCEPVSASPENVLAQDCLTQDCLTHDGAGALRSEE